MDELLLTLRDYRRAARGRPAPAAKPPGRGLGGPAMHEPRPPLPACRRAARARLSPTPWDYFRSAAGAQGTLRANRRAFARWSLYYRVLVDVSAPRLATTLL